MLTDLQTTKLTRYFQVYDIDDDGVIQASDFERIVENVRILHGIRGNGPDVLREAYMGLWDRLRAGADADGDRGVDLDEDQSIGPNEFEDFYGVFGLSVSLAETVFTELDTNGDGKITRDDLLEMSRQFYRSDDVEAPGNVLFGPYGA